MLQSMKYSNKKKLVCERVESDAHLNTGIQIEGGTVNVIQFL